MPLPSLISGKDRRLRLGRAGLASLMRDPRYLDANHAEHGPMVDLVRRGFELVFDEPEDADRPASAAALARRRRPTLLTETRPARPFAEAVAQLARGEAMPGGEAGAGFEALGWRTVLGALRSAGAAFPSGLADELRALDRPTKAAASNPPSRDAKPDKPKTPEGPEGPEEPRNPKGKEGEDGECESLRREMEARNAEHKSIRSEIERLTGELRTLKKERQSGMPSVNDEDRRAGRGPRAPEYDPSGVERDTPDARRRRGGRAPKLGIDLSAMREQMIRHRDTAQRRVRRAKEIEARTREIRARLHRLDIEREKAGREAARAELRHSNCRVLRKLGSGAGK